MKASRLVAGMRRDAGLGHAGSVIPASRDLAVEHRPPRPPAASSKVTSPRRQLRQRSMRVARHTRFASGRAFSTGAVADYGLGRARRQVLRRRTLYWPRSTATSSGRSAMYGEKHFAGGDGKSPSSTRTLVPVSRDVKYYAAPRSRRMRRGRHP